MSGRGRYNGREFNGGRSFRNRSGYQASEKSGPPRLDNKNPSSDQVTRYLNKMKDYLEGEGNTVYTRTDAIGIQTIEKMSLIFGSASE